MVKVTGQLGEAPRDKEASTLGQKGRLGVWVGPIQVRGPSAASLPAQLCSHARDGELLPGPAAHQKLPLLPK